MYIGTLLYTWLRGELVGIDEFSNRYYRSIGSRLRGLRNLLTRHPRGYYRGTGGKLHGRERRWVLYKGKAEASKVPPEWHAWLHHTTEAPLSENAAEPLAWQKNHLPNLTGTTEAYRPRGHDLMGGQHAPSAGDYQPWKPE